jgi:chromosome segregation ATPase
LERFEKLQETIHKLRSEITQLEKEKCAQTDQLHEIQERASQLDIDNNKLTIKMKQLKDLLEHKKERTPDYNHDDGDNDQQQQELLSTINNDVEKANQHMRDLHSGIEEKTRRVKELDTLLNQEKDRCRELETKLKVVLELRERDAHLHIRQLGQTDAELRKARTDTERVRILQQQLEFKQ